MRVIWTTFAKHPDTLPVHLANVQKLIELGHVHEVHVWHEAARELASVISTSVNLFPFSHKREYYAHYTREAYPCHIIIHALDDIVYIDCDHFPEFINHRKALEHPLLYTNIINHGTCIMQQQASDLINLGITKHDAIYGKLWKSGDLAERLHSTFIDNMAEWQARIRSQPVRVHKSRFGLLFFAITSRDLDIFRACKNNIDDEAELTYFNPHETGKYNAIDLSFIVSHLSFSKQDFDKQAVLQKYISKMA